jgi:hypothetical protein
MPKVIVLLCDGTDKSDRSEHETNVVKLRDAILKNAAVMVKYEEGVGSRAIMIPGDAFGLGIRLRVIKLYRYFCEHYSTNDSVFVFGFSRGAVTARILAALIQHQRKREAAHARRAHTSFLLQTTTSWPWRVNVGWVLMTYLVLLLFERTVSARMDHWSPTVVAARLALMLPTLLLWARSGLAAYTSGDSFGHRVFGYLTGWLLLVTTAVGIWEVAPSLAQSWILVAVVTGLAAGCAWAVSQLNPHPAGDEVPVAFLGVWDTVDAYGFSVDEVAVSINKWIAPFTVDLLTLPNNVKAARHALSLDDERASFHPVLWTPLGEEATPRSEEQRWFCGVHSDVGGGYKEAGLSNISLAWMMTEATAAGLPLKSDALTAVNAARDVNDLLHDSRQGKSALYRYKPRSPHTPRLDGTHGPPCLDPSVAERTSPDGWTIGRAAAQSRPVERVRKQAAYRAALTYALYAPIAAAVGLAVLAFLQRPLWIAAVTLLLLIVVACVARRVDKRLRSQIAAAVCEEQPATEWTDVRFRWRLEAKIWALLGNLAVIPVLTVFAALPLAFGYAASRYVPKLLGALGR